MKVIELPERNKFFTIILSSGAPHQIDGQTKINIMSSQSQFIELKDGSCINKSFIVQIKFDYDSTRDSFLKLTQSEQNKIVNQVKRLK